MISDISEDVLPPLDDYLPGLFFDIEDGERYVPPKRRQTSVRLRALAVASVAYTHTSPSSVACCLHGRAVRTG